MHRLYFASLCFAIGSLLLGASSCANRSEAPWDEHDLQRKYTIHHSLATERAIKLALGHIEKIKNLIPNHISNGPTVLDYARRDASASRISDRPLYCLSSCTLDFSDDEIDLTYTLYPMLDAGNDEAGGLVSTKDIRDAYRMWYAEASDLAGAVGGTIHRK